MLAKNGAYAAMWARRRHRGHTYQGVVADAEVNEPWICLAIDTPESQISPIFLLEVLVKERTKDRCIAPE